MTRILNSLRHEGAHAFRKSIWAVSGAALCASAAVFAAAALVSGLSEVMPLYGALACGAALLGALAVICFYAASRTAHAPEEMGKQPLPSRQTYLPDLAYHLLESEIRAQPGKTATAAVVAGLILGALDALEGNERSRAPQQ